MEIYEQIRKRAEANYQSNKELIKRLKRRPPADLDEIFRDLHDEVFIRINCLECANCCRSLGPRITDKDIEKIAKYLKLKPSGFTEIYLRMDEDGDYVFKTMPCPFIQPDNHCSIYDNRPSACRDYPHTNRRRMYQVLDIMLKNSLICPAVGEILKGIKGIKGSKGSKGSRDQRDQRDQGIKGSKGSRDQRDQRDQGIKGIKGIKGSRDQRDQGIKVETHGCASE